MLPRARRALLIRALFEDLATAIQRNWALEYAQAEQLVGELRAEQGLDPWTSEEIRDHATHILRRRDM